MNGKYALMKNAAWKASLGILVGLGISFAQDFDVSGDGSNAGVILQGKNINSSPSDNIGVHGISTPKGFYGIGVKGTGGYIGVLATSQFNGSNVGVGSRYGVSAAASYGATNYGVVSSASGSGLNYGVYSTASGTNSRAGYFGGDLEYTGSLLHSSDRKLKKNISEYKNSLAVINRLSTKEYDYRSDEFPALKLPKGHQVGLVAQEVEEALPELVHESVMPETEKSKDPNVASFVAAKKPDTYKTVDYVALIPYLVGAIQEQSAEIARLKRRVGEGQ